MSPYTVTNPATGQLEAEYPSATESGVRQAIADAAFAVLKHIDVPGTFPPPPAAPQVEIYLSLRGAADPHVTDKLDKQGNAWESFATPPYRHESGAGTPRRSARQADLVHAGGIGVGLDNAGKPHATWSPIPPIPWPPHAREP